MNVIELTTEDIIKVASNKYGVEIMGDDFIGFKFIGEEALFWNSLLQEKHNQGIDVSVVMNSSWLKSNGIPYVEHSSDIWNLF